MSEQEKMPDLRMAVKREYFEAHKNGSKSHEYRLTNEYWRKRLEGKDYATITLTLGYPKRGDKSRETTFPYRGYSVEKRTHKHFGKDEVEVFAIVTNGEIR